ncbi:hypothetical protein F4811DRAFT_548198 [Daldinia bambusicola]|nr:hypothetical protein F4811DRAFT_548198 [Daldinia bambusicola]
MASPFLSRTQPVSSPRRCSSEDIYTKPQLSCCLSSVNTDRSKAAVSGTKRRAKSPHKYVAPSKKPRKCSPSSSEKSLHNIQPHQVINPLQSPTQLHQLIEPSRVPKQTHRPEGTMQEWLQLQEWLQSESSLDVPPSPSTITSTSYSTSIHDNHDFYDDMASSQTLFASSAYDNKTGSSSYRSENLGQNGVTLLTDDEEPPDWVKKLVQPILNDKVPELDNPAKFETLFKQLHVERRDMQSQCEPSELDLRTILSSYLPFHFQHLKTDYPVLAQNLNCASDRLFNNDVLDIFKDVVDRLTRPVPDLSFGYHVKDLFYDSDTRQTLLPWYNTGSISSKALLFYPYFFIEHKPVGGNLYHAQNQCMTDTAVALEINWPVIPDNENVVYSMGINHHEVKFHIGWLDEGLNKKGEAVREYKLWLFCDTHLGTREKFKQVWQIVFNIHKWAICRREKLEKRMAEQIAEQADQEDNELAQVLRRPRQKTKDIRAKGRNASTKRVASL